MKKWLVASCAALAGFLIAFSPMDARSEEEDELAYIYGTVKSITPKQISVLEYDIEEDIEVERVILIDPKVSLENVTSLKEITSGKQVSVGYEEIKGKKVAKTIELNEGDPAEETDSAE